MLIDVIFRAVDKDIVYPPLPVFMLSYAKDALAVAPFLKHRHDSDMPKLFPHYVSARETSG